MITNLNSKDIGDKSNNGGIAILQVDSIQGKYRNFWEHLNNAAPMIGWGTLAYNPNNSPITITLTGTGATDEYPIIYFFKFKNKACLAGNHLCRRGTTLLI